MRYQVVRSVQDKTLHVICYDEKFESVPDPIRHLGPWQGLMRGDIDVLKNHYRMQLAEQGFVLVHHTTGAFAPEHQQIS